MHMLLRLLFIMLSGIYLEIAVAQSLRYEAPLKTGQWQLEASPLVCRLSQEIPRYGRVAFEQKHAQAPQMHLEFWQGLTQGTKADVCLVPAPWDHRHKVKVLGDVWLEPGQDIISLRRPLTETLLRGLQAGMVPLFRYHSGMKNERTTIRVSQVDFNKMYLEYNRCLGQLLPFPKEVVKFSNLYFGHKGAELSDTDKMHLRKIVTYMKANPDVTHVKVDGYTDNVGRKGINNFMSEQRAKAVEKYLIAHGLDKSKIKLWWYGVKNPVADNTTTQGRKLNRRVEIRLLER